eukprot:3810542-Rhodomonas_salina.1
MRCCSARDVSESRPNSPKFAQIRPNSGETGQIRPSSRRCPRASCRCWAQPSPAVRHADQRSQVPRFRAWISDFGVRFLSFRDCLSNIQVWFFLVWGSQPGRARRWPR